MTAPNPAWMRATYQHILRAGQREAAKQPQNADHWRGFQRGAIALATALGIVRSAEREEELLRLLEAGRAERMARHAARQGTPATGGMRNV